MDRREFLVDSVGAAILTALPADLFSQTGRSPRSEAWDSGRVRHLLPTVSDTRMLIKASFTEPLSASPVLRIGGKSMPGRMNDTRGEFWHGFTLADFLPDRIVLRFFKWDIRTQPPEAIDSLEPFHTAELRRPI